MPASDADGWLEVARLELNQQVGKPDPRSINFGEVLNHWLAYGKTKTGEEKDDSTKRTDERNARNYLSRWADRVAKDIEPLEYSSGSTNRPTAFAPSSEAG